MVNFDPRKRTNNKESGPSLGQEIDLIGPCLSRLSHDDSKEADQYRALEEPNNTNLEHKEDDDRAIKLTIAGNVIIGDLEYFSDHLPFGFLNFMEGFVDEESDDYEKNSYVHAVLSYAFIPTLIQQVSMGRFDIEAINEGFIKFKSQCKGAINMVYIDANSLDIDSIKQIIERFGVDNYAILDASSDVKNKLSSCNFSCSIVFKESFKSMTPMLGPLHVAQFEGETVFTRVGRTISDYSGAILPPIT